jgi:cobalt-zinc-cadmium efflux system outer membrane protein
MSTSILIAGAWIAALLGAPQQQAPPDTVVLDAAEAFRMALEAAPTMTTADRRLRASEARIEQASAWPNPLLSVTAENVGASRSVSGVEGIRGLEGQVVLGTTLPLGGDRRAARSWAEASALEARSLSAGAEVDVRLALVEALANVERDRARLERARAEAVGLEQLAGALSEQAARGRAADGEASRAHLASVSAHAAAAEIAVEASMSETRLASLLGLPPSTIVEVVAAPCVPPSAVGGEGASAVAELPEVPELAAAKARERAASAALAESRARRVPDLLPQLGVRRVGGISALYVGVSMTLPVFDRASGSVRAASHELEAAAAEAERVQRALGAEREATKRGWVTLEEAGRLYDAIWLAALDRAVSAAEARYRLGEGTLTELLDGRRARQQALDDYERWRAQMVIQSARLARLEARPIEAALVCTPSLAVPHPAGEN